jgi:2-phosphosulfolactate phosphatase
VTRQPEGRHPPGGSLFSDQSPFPVRFEWGERGLESVAAGCGVFVIVDVLSFCTCVAVAVGRGAVVLPYRWRDDTAAAYAREQRAVLADADRTSLRYSLSPASLANIAPSTRLVLPSPNGAALSLRAGAIAAPAGAAVVAACLRNAPAVAAFARSTGSPVSVIACGERWPDGSLRPAWEDLIGAGAVITDLPGPRSPEAEAACDAFRGAQADLSDRLRACVSGRELIEREFEADMDLAASGGSSSCVPALCGNAFVDRRSYESLDSVRPRGVSDMNSRR